MIDGQEYQSVVDEVEIEGDIEETDDKLMFDVVLAKEIVQEYRDHGRVYKPADELEKAAEVSGSVYITDGHPPAGIVKKQSEVYGEISSDTLGFQEDGARVTGRAEVFKDQAPDSFVQEIKDEERDSVSIGFYTQLDRSGGEWNDQEYDAAQTDILLDHLAVLKPENEGRCSVENGCGITQNMDQITTPVADRQEVDADPQAGQKGKGDYDIAVNEPEDPREIAEDISSLGYEVEMRPCNCGDHEGHLTIFEASEDGSDRTYLNEDEKSSDKDSGANSSMNLEDIKQLDKEEVFMHPDVQDLKESKESLEDQVSDLEDEKESLESDKEDLQEELDSIREEEADELRDELQDSFGIDEERVEDKGLDELETMKDTLEAADLEQKDRTSTNPGGQTSTDSKSKDTKVGTGGTGPYADEYNEDE